MSGLDLTEAIVTAAALYDDPGLRQAAIDGAGAAAPLIERQVRERAAAAALRQIADELSSYRWAGKAVAYIQGSTDRIARGLS